MWPACGQHGVVGLVRVRNGVVMIDKQLCKGYKTCCKHYKLDVCVLVIYGLIDNNNMCI